MYTCCQNTHTIVRTPTHYKTHINTPKHFRGSLLLHVNSWGKGKAVPLQALSDLEGSRKLRFRDYLKKTQVGGKVVSLTHWPHVLYKEVKVKQSRYRPGVAQRVPAQDGGKAVSLMHRPHLPPGNTPGTNFCQRLSRPQGHIVIRRIYVNEKFQWHHLGLNGRPSDL
jgi:hypothetical protein